MALACPTAFLTFQQQSRLPHRSLSHQPFTHARALKHYPSEISAVSLAVLASVTAVVRGRIQGPRRSALTLLRAARIESSSSAVCFKGEVIAPGRFPESPDDAPPGGSRAWDELQFLAADPMQRRLGVTAFACAELQASAFQAWAAITGATSTLEESWLALQLTSCYGIPWPLQLLRVSGKVEPGAEVAGEVGAFGSVFRKFKWTVVDASFQDEAGSLLLEACIEDEPSSFRHAIRISSRQDGGCDLESEIHYSPEPPLQTLLNALGGRNSVKNSNAGMLRRLGILLDGDLDFDPDPFYNMTAPVLDLLAPFEDEARLRLSRAGLTAQVPLTVLEVGCGTGRWAKSLLESTACPKIYVGVDSAESMAQAAASSLAARPPGMQVAVVQGDARKAGLLEELSETFFKQAPDRIVMCYVLDLMDDADCQKVLSACAGLLLKSNGMLCVTSICPGSPLMSAWEAAWNVAPSILGGCRPQDVAGLLSRSNWEIISEEQVDIFGYTSQVVVAKPNQASRDS